ncbi:MAG: pyridoxal-dependent decarboxylase [Planctomycetota bacterium]|nr:pyridoxal-dependent decarboxylase [Planctomycetota bacterium]
MRDRCRLELSPEEMTALVDEVSRRVIDFISRLPDQPAHSPEGGEELAAALREPPPEEGSPLDTILDTLFERVIPCAFNTAGPGYLAYIPGGGLYSAAVAEYLAAAVNRYSGVWAAAPGAVEVETQALRWLAQLVGLPEGSLGVLTTGGSFSNLIAVAAAREKLLGDDFAQATIYFSEEVHYSVPKAARVVGIRPTHFRSIPVDDEYRLRVDRLEAQILEDRAAGLRPLLVCGSVGTVNTGAVDPLADIADVAARQSVWFHVDGAYGGVFRMVPELEHLFDGVERADSVAVDPHKGLFLAYGTGALLVREIDDLRRAYSDTASYLPEMRQGSEHVDFSFVSPELSRDWRGLRLWLPFKLHGVRAFREALREKRQLAVQAFEALSAEPDIEVAAPPELSLFAFRQRHPGVDREEENRRNRRLLGRINAPRRIMVTGTEVGGKYWVRICVLHLRTHRERVDEGLDIIRESLAAERRTAGA